MAKFADKWRKEIRELPKKQLLKELQIPTGIWKEDITREVLYRLLKGKETEDYEL